MIRSDTKPTDKAFLFAPWITKSGNARPNRSLEKQYLSIPCKLIKSSSYSSMPFQLFFLPHCRPIIAKNSAIPNGYRLLVRRTNHMVVLLFAIYRQTEETANRHGGVPFIDYSRSQCHWPQWRRRRRQFNSYSSHSLLFSYTPAWRLMYDCDRRIDWWTRARRGWRTTE